MTVVMWPAAEVPFEQVGKLRDVARLLVLDNVRITTAQDIQAADLLTSDLTDLPYLSNRRSVLAGDWDRDIIPERRLTDTEAIGIYGVALVGNASMYLSDLELSALDGTFVKRDGDPFSDTWATVNLRRLCGPPADPISPQRAGWIGYLSNPVLFAPGSHPIISVRAMANMLANITEFALLGVIAGPRDWIRNRTSRSPFSATEET